MKHFADNKRSFRQFAVGDSVYLKLQPYIQTSLAARSSNKLSFHYFGPFKITERIGSVAYRLALPESSSIHPEFHVSQLKKAISASHQVSTYLTNSFSYRFLSAFWIIGSTVNWIRLFPKS